MGQWGRDLFDDDTFLEVWNEYRAFLAFGTPEDEAYNIVKNYFLPMLEETNRTCVFWLTMAAVQQRHGILMQEVKDNALYCIDNRDKELKSLFLCFDNSPAGFVGSMRSDGKYDEEYYDLLYGGVKDNLQGDNVNLFYWYCPGFRKRRNKVLDKLKENLVAPPLPKKKVSKPSWYLGTKPRWKIGELVVSRVGSSNYKDKWWCNKYVLYRVAHINRNSVSKIKPDLAYGEMPYGALYNWIGDEIPSPDIVNDLDFFKFSYPVDAPYGIQLLCMSRNPYIQELSLLQRESEYPMPTKDEIAKISGQHILHMLTEEESEPHFKALYERYSDFS